MPEVTLPSILCTQEEPTTMSGIEWPELKRLDMLKAEQEIRQLVADLDARHESTAATSPAAAHSSGVTGRVPLSGELDYDEEVRSPAPTCGDVACVRAWPERPERTCATLTNMRARRRESCSPVARSNRVFLRKGRT